VAGSNVGKWLMVALAACFLSSGIEALGQSTFGSIVGTVKDQSGSVVPGTTVTLVIREAPLHERCVQGL
jgi:hypothetical protein